MCGLQENTFTDLDTKAISLLGLTSAPKDSAFFPSWTHGMRLPHPWITRRLQSKHFKKNHETHRVLASGAFHSSLPYSCIAPIFQPDLHPHITPHPQKAQWSLTMLISLFELIRGRSAVL